MGRGFESDNEHLHLDEIEETIHDPSVVMINRQSRHLKVCIWSELGKDDVKEEKHNAFVLLFSVVGHFRICIGIRKLLACVVLYWWRPMHGRHNVRAKLIWDCHRRRDAGSYRTSMACVCEILILRFRRSLYSEEDERRFASATDEEDVFYT